MPTLQVDREFVTAELNARIAVNLNMIEKLNASLKRKEVPQDRVWLPYRTFSSSHLDIGVCHTILGNRIEALQSFRASAVSMQQSELLGKGETVPIDLARKPEVAILSRDRDLAREVARLMLPSSPDMKTFTLYSRALCSLLAGEGEREAVENLKKVPEKTAKNQQFYPGLGEACEAIATGNAESFNRTLAGILESHILKSRSRKNQPDSFLCITATALSLLAIDRGLEVDVDPRYHKYPITMMAVFSLRDRSIKKKIPVDLVPLKLLA